jgi:hypothetical protein
MNVPLSLQLALLVLVLVFISYKSAQEDKKWRDVMTNEMRVLEEREELLKDSEKIAQRNKERIQGDVRVFLTNAFLDYSKEVNTDTCKTIEEFYKYTIGLIEEKL